MPKRKLRVSQSFNDEEVRLLEYILRSVAEGKEGSILSEPRTSTFRRLIFKAKTMKRKMSEK